MMHPSSLGHPSGEKRLGFGKVFSTGILADPLIVDDLVDVPDATAVPAFVSRSAPSFRFQRG